MLDWNLLIFNINKNTKIKIYFYLETNCKKNTTKCILDKIIFLNEKTDEEEILNAVINKNYKDKEYLEYYNFVINTLKNEIKDFVKTKIDKFCYKNIKINKLTNLKDPKYTTKFLMENWKVEHKTEKFRDPEIFVETENEDKFIYINNPKKVFGDFEDELNEIINKNKQNDISDFLNFHYEKCKGEIK